MDRKVLRSREMRLFKHKGWMVVRTISKWQEVVFDAFSCFEPVIIVIIRLCLEPNIEITLGHNLAVFTRSAITQPIVNDLDEICSNLNTLLGAGPGTFCAVTTVWEAGKVFFVTDFPTYKFYIWTQQRWLVLPCKLSEQNLENFTISGYFSKNKQKLLTKFPRLATSGRHNHTDCRKFTTK